MTNKKFTKVYKKANRAGYREISKYGTYEGTEEQQQAYRNFNYTRGYTESVYNQGRHKGVVTGIGLTVVGIAACAGAKALLDKHNAKKVIVVKNDNEDSFDDDMTFFDDGFSAVNAETPETNS